MKVESESEIAQSFLTLCDPMDTRLLRPWDFLGKSTGVGCHFLLQGIFLTQGLNPGLPHCRQTLYHLSHQGSHSSLSYMQMGHVRFQLSQLGWKKEPAEQETWIQSLGGEGPLEKEMATHSSIRAWEIHRQRSLAWL